MNRAVVIAASAVLFGSEAEAAAMLVTMTTGAVSIKDSSGTRQAPAGGFPLLEGQTLVIAQGASAVVLSQGSAQKINGPKSISTDDTIASARSDLGDSSSALARVMSRKVSVNAVGATRGGGGFSLTRPVEGTKLASLKSIQWTCGNCGEQTIEVIHLESFEPVWEGTGTTQLTCEGLALDPGEYAVKVDDQYLAFSVVPEHETKEITTAVSVALGFASGLDIASQATIEAGIWWQAGMPTEALYALDKALVTAPGNAELTRLISEYQRRLTGP